MRSTSSSSRGLGPPEQDLLAGVLALPGVAEAADAARSAIDRLLSHRILRQRGAEVSAESALRGARASAELDGVVVSLADLRAGSDHPVLVGALRVSAAVGDLVPVWERAPLQVLARLHMLAAAGRVPDEELGRPTAGGAAHLPARLVTLARLAAGGSTTVPAVVLAAIVHGEVLTLAPFGCADGLVARAATRLVLISRGFDPKGVGVPEVGHVERRQEYLESAAAYAAGTAEGVARWVRHCCAAVELGAQEGLAVCEALQRG